MRSETLQLSVHLPEMIGCFKEACCCRVTLDDDYDYDEDASVQFVYFLIAQLRFPVMLQQHFRYRAKQMTSAVTVK